MGLMQFVWLKALLPGWARKRLRDPWQRVLEREQSWRERRFYRQFIDKGDLVFDVGANIGNKTEAFLSIGANVVAVEPHPGCIQSLETRFKDACATGALHIEKVAVAATSGTIELRVFDSNPELTSGSSSFAEYTREYLREPDRVIQTKTVTLDQLVERYAVPKFLKVDVEGMDAEVLSGLTVRPRFLSFEYHTGGILWAEARKCLAETERLGFTEVNLTHNAALNFTLPQWLPIAGAASEIERLLGPGDHWGDMVVR
jgi:FkbM family methyltransferase